MTSSAPLAELDNRYEKNSKRLFPRWPNQQKQKRYLCNLFAIHPSTITRGPRNPCLSCAFALSHMLVLVHAPELLRILMTASSATARFLSLAVLLLSLAPLASLYIVFFSLFGVEPSSFALLESGGSEWQNAAQALLNSQQAAAGGAESNADTSGMPQQQPIDWTQIANNRTALEELLKVMYQEASKHQPHHPLWMLSVFSPVL